MSSDDPTATSSTARGDGQELSTELVGGSYQKASTKSWWPKMTKEAPLRTAVEGSGSVIAEPDNPGKVITKQMALVVPGRHGELLDLAEDLKEQEKRFRYERRHSIPNPATLTMIVCLPE